MNRTIPLDQKFRLGDPEVDSLSYRTTLLPLIHFCWLDPSFLGEHDIVGDIRV